MTRGRRVERHLPAKQEQSFLLYFG
jgi:hypothetical protein